MKQFTNVYHFHYLQKMRERKTLLPLRLFISEKKGQQIIWFLENWVNETSVYFCVALFTERTILGK